MDISFNSPRTLRTELFHTEPIQERDAHVLYCSTFWKWTLTPFALLTLPIALIACAIVTLVHYIFHKTTFQELVAKTLALPALALDQAYLTTRRRQIPENQIIHLQTEDQITLEGVELKRENSTKWIIHLNGNRGSYETNYQSLQNMADETDCNILCINYRGVGRSQGFCRSSDDIHKDGRAAVEHLLSKSVTQENITLYGYSLGGGVGALVANDYPHVHFISDRSFSSLTQAIETFFWMPLYGKLIAYVVGLWWNLDSSRVMPNLRGRIKLITSHEDLIIGFENASLYSSFSRRNITPPPTLHVRYAPDEIFPCLGSCREYALIHYYDLPRGTLHRLISHT